MDVLGLIMQSAFSNQSNIKLKAFAIPATKLTANSNASSDTDINIPELTSGSPYAIFINNTHRLYNKFTDFESQSIGGSESTSISTSPNIAMVVFPRSGTYSAQLVDQNSGDQYQIYIYFYHMATRIYFRLINNSDSNLSPTTQSFTFLAALFE